MQIRLPEEMRSDEVAEQLTCNIQFGVSGDFMIQCHNIDDGIISILDSGGNSLTDATKTALKKLFADTHSGIEIISD